MATNTTTPFVRAELERKAMPELKTLCKSAGVPVTGAKQLLVEYLLDPANNQKGKRKAAGGGAASGQSKAAKAARAMAGPWSDGARASEIDPAAAEAELRRYVTRCAGHVDANWHDCYEETGELLHEYMRACLARAEACLDVARSGEGYDRCHRTLCAIADTWDDMNAIPFRGCPREDISSGDTEPIGVLGGSFSTCDPAALAALGLPLVLALAAADERVTDAALARMLKDCVDHGAPRPHEASDEEAELGATLPAAVAAGRARLAPLFANTGAWASLPSWKPNHKMRRAIDRRFDGPKHRRTRDYDSDCGFFGGGDYDSYGDY